MTFKTLRTILEIAVSDPDKDDKNSWTLSHLPAGEQEDAWVCVKCLRALVWRH